MVGVSDFTVRLPSVIAALVMAIATFVVGRRMGGPAVGWLSVGALLGMYEFWDTATQARVDMVFSACIAVSLAGFYFWYRDGHRAARTAFYLGAALAVLAKGPAGLVLPVLVIASFLLIDKRLDKLPGLWSWPLVSATLIIDLGWYVSAYAIGDDDFVKLQIQRENFDRVFGSAALNDRENLVTIAGWLLTRTLPASLVLFWSLMRRMRGEREDSAGRFLHIWWMSIFIVFASAAGKRAVYLLPVYPAIAILAARALGRILAQPQLAPRGDHSARMASSCEDGLVRRFFKVKAIVAGIVLFDTMLMLIGRGVWSDVGAESSRLAFVNRLGTIVPADKAIFATPEFGDNNLMIIAYRLSREIERKPIRCGARNEYFLTPFSSRQDALVGAQVLASSKAHNISLVTLPFGRRTAGDNGCAARKSP